MTIKIVSKVTAIQQITLVHNGACIGKSISEYIDIGDTRKIESDWRPDNLQEILHSVCGCKGDCLKDCPHYAVYIKFIPELLKALEKL